jgi:uncharacterized protein YyaL (SSP411 family)
MSNVQAVNNIHWNEYSNKTLQKAQNENKAIFLFVYSPTSKWAKKMEEESFNDPVIVELLNERFITIKINRDERPEIERYYHKIYKLMNREITSSPLSLFLTANLEPFYAGSYLPKEDINEQLSFESLLRIISKKYVTDYETLSKKGQEVLSFVNLKEQKIEATKLNINILNTITQHSNTLLDKMHGGFGTKPKFPNISTLQLLLDTYQLNNNIELLNAVTLTLDKMLENGLYDTKNGAFFTYAKDEAWKVPYEEKTTYDNAQFIQLYLNAYNLTNNEKYKYTAFETIEFMLKNRNETKLFSLKNEKTITSWNALMVQALFTASNVDEKYKTVAFESLDALLSKLYVSGTLYHTKPIEGKEKISAFLDDYSCLGEALILAYQNSFDESFLIMATQLSNLLIEQYYEQAHWVYATNSFKLKENIHDKETPSAISSSLSLLLSVASLVDNNYKKFVFKTLEIHSYSLMRQPFSSPKLSNILLRYLKDDIIIKAKEETLKEYMNRRETLPYPYLYYKSILEDELSINNSHSKLKSIRDFDEVKKYLESL